MAPWGIYFKWTELRKLNGGFVHCCVLGRVAHPADVPALFESPLEGLS